MSVDVAVFLVDWDEFADRLARDGEDVSFEGDRREPIPRESWSAAGEFVWVFEAMPGKWKAGGKRPLMKILDTLFWSWRSKPRVMDLAIVPDGLTGIESALSPQRVGRLAEAVDAVNLDRCEAFFEKAAKKAGVGRFETFAEYREYIEAWFDMIRRAAAGGKGMIVAVFG